jgi:Tfp pilus assembly protein PilN
LQAEVSRREQIMALITQQNLGNAEGFSRQMRSMARQSLDTMQIDNFSLQAGGGYMEMSGRTRQADQVPLYLQRLRAEDSFQRVRFGVLNVEREERGRELSFSVSKTGGEKP